MWAFKRSGPTFLTTLYTREIIILGLRRSEENLLVLSAHDIVM